MTATITLDPESGKIIDINAISGYGEDGRPKYGVIQCRGENGFYPYGCTPKPE